MAAPVKKRDIERNTEEKGSDDDDQGSLNSMGEEENLAPEQGMEIQVDFEGRNPSDPDYHGIKTLLQQLFLKAHIDLGGLTDLIISQNYVGSIVKQSEDFEESDDEENDINDVFGITTVVNLSNGQNLSCIQHLRDLLRQLASEHASESTNAMIKSVLDNDSSAAIGLLINERFVNISAEISVPLLENLVSEIRRANNKSMPFNFSYYILICKLHKKEDKKSGNKTKNRKKGGEDESNVLWSNPEEEIFADEAPYSFEFSVEKESDSGLTGAWAEADDELTPYRRVLLLEASQLQPIIDKIKHHIS